MLELEHGFRVVDVNARFPTGEGTWPRTPRRGVSPDRLEREMHQAGVVRAVVSPQPDSEGDYLQANNNVARQSVDRPFVAFARINGPRRVGSDPADRARNLIARRGDGHTSPADVEQYAYDDRFRGFAIDPAVDGVPDEAVLDRLEDVDLPVYVTAGVDAPPSALTDSILTRSFPVIVGHFGGHPLDRSLMNETIDLLSEYDRWYLDTSFVRYREVLERALLEHPDRVLFGTGTPACHPNVAVMELLTLDVSEDLLRRAFAKNATRVVDSLAPDYGSTIGP